MGTLRYNTRVQKGKDVGEQALSSKEAWREENIPQITTLSGTLCTHSVHSVLLVVVLHCVICVVVLYLCCVLYIVWSCFFFVGWVGSDWLLFPCVGGKSNERETGRDKTGKGWEGKGKGI